jgi:ketosteroid isomerase-like protein
VTATNVEVLRDLFAAANERDFPRALAHYAPDVELVVPSGLHAGTFTGRDAVGRWMGDWYQSFDREARFEFDDIVELDADSVLVVAKHHARGRASGAEIHGQVIWIYRLSARKIVHIEGFESRQDAEAAPKRGMDPPSR